MIIVEFRWWIYGCLLLSSFSLSVCLKIVMIKYWQGETLPTLLLSHRSENKPPRSLKPFPRPCVLWHNDRWQSQWRGTHTETHPVKSCSSLTGRQIFSNHQPFLFLSRFVFLCVCELDSHLHFGLLLNINVMLLFLRARRSRRRS